MQKSVYIGFENEVTHYHLHYGVINNPLKIRKGNGALKNLLKIVESDQTVSCIMFLDGNNKPYNTLYVNDDMVMLTREQEFITINLNTEKVWARELEWWVNDDEDFKEFLENLFATNEIEFDDEMMSSIILRFKNQ